MVFTDGDSDDPDVVRSAAQAWAQNGATILAIGIGIRISDAGLQNVVGMNGRVFRVANFKDIHNHASALLKQVCETVLESKS